MKLGRNIAIGVGVIVIVVVALIAYVWSSLDSLVAAAIETYGSEATQTPVRVSGVKLELTQGRGSITGLTVANPDGFSAPQAFSLGGISTAIDTATITEDPIVIDEIVIQAPQVVYEIDAQGRSNVNVLKDRLGGGGASQEQGPSSSAEPGPRLIIRRLLIERGQIDVNIAALPNGDKTIKLPRIELKDIGAKSNGASGAEVAEKVLTVLIERVATEVGSLGVDKYLGKSAEEIEQGLKDRLDSELGDGAGEQGADALKKLLGK
jgi:hypothetical protein